MNASVIRAALFSGSGAAIASIAAIAALARIEGKPAIQPVNATTHSFYGPEIAASSEVDLARTVPGLGINIGAALFWGGVHSLIAPSGSTAQVIVGRAFLTALAAGVIDYAIVPKQLRPGWEHSIRPASVLLALAAMGAGLAAGRLAGEK